MAQRIYKQSAIYDARIAGLRNLWDPSTEYQGKKIDKPNYLVTVLIKKTRAAWHEEPALEKFAQSCTELYNAALTHIPFQQVIWPIKDGDVDELGRAAAEWRKGSWILNGSSTSPIEVFINRGGVPVSLPSHARGEVKSGDYVSITTSIAVKANDPRGIKTYINKVIFMGSGEEIIMGNATSANELMEQARAAGMNVTGFGGSGVPQHGFGTEPLPILATAPPLNWGQQGLAPSPVSPPAQQGFGTPGAFTPPTGFPQRS
jgi:hypothetical protein